MNQRPRLEAFVYGVGGGGLVVVAGSLVPWFSGHDLLSDLVWFGSSILVVPAAAASSAMASGAAPPRVLAVAGLAFLLAFFVMNVVDYGLTVLLFAPDAPGPFQGTNGLSADDVDTIAGTWLLGRHIVLCTLGILGGSALGVWRGRAAVSKAQVVG